MKIVHISDLHIGKRVNGYSMIDDQKYILNQIIDKIDDIKPDIIFICGDVYDKTIPTSEAVELLDNFLTQIVIRKIKVFMIYGNHDSAERLSFAKDILKSSDIFISKIFNGEVEKFSLNYDFGTVNIFLLPFLKPLNVKNFYKDEQINDYNDAIRLVLSDIKVDKSQINIMLAHQFLTGSEISKSEELAIGGLDNVDASLFYDFDYVALGHLHKPQKVIRETVRYSGTPLKYSFSEINHKKSITVIDISSKDNIKIKLEHLTPKRDLREIKGKYQDLIKEENYKNTNIDDYVHIILTDEEEGINAVSVLSNIYKNVMKISYDNKRTRINNTVIEPNQYKQKNLLEIFDDLYLLQNGDSLSHEQREYLTKIINEVGDE